MTKVNFRSPPKNFGTPSDTQPPHTRGMTSCALARRYHQPQCCQLITATIQHTRQVTLPFSATLDDTLVWADPSSLSGHFR